MDNLVALVALLAISGFAAYVIHTGRRETRETINAIIALKLSGGDSREFRTAIEEQSSEPAEEIPQEDPEPAGPIQVGNEEVVDFIAHGSSVDEILGNGWRTK